MIYFNIHVQIIKVDFTDIFRKNYLLVTSFRRLAMQRVGELFGKEWVLENLAC